MDKARRKRLFLLSVEVEPTWVPALCMLLENCASGRYGRSTHDFSFSENGYGILFRVV